MWARTRPECVWTGVSRVCICSLYSSALQQQLLLVHCMSRMEQPQTILREKHIKYFKRCLSILPSMFSELDPNRYAQLQVYCCHLKLFGSVCIRTGCMFIDE